MCTSKLDKNHKTKHKNNTNCGIAFEPGAPRNVAPRQNDAPVGQAPYVPGVRPSRTLQDCDRDALPTMCLSFNRRESRSHTSALIKDREQMTHVQKKQSRNFCGQ